MAKPYMYTYPSRQRPPAPGLLPTTYTHNNLNYWHAQHQHQHEPLPLTKTEIYRTSRARLSMALPLILLVAIAGMAGLQWLNHYYRGHHVREALEGS